MRKRSTAVEFAERKRIRWKIASTRFSSVNNCIYVFHLVSLL